MTQHSLRDIFCNRTLNFRSIDAIGYDLDYTLVHYNTHEWERCAYRHAQARLAEMNWPVDGLLFDPEGVIQGLTIDLELGNLLKVTRFGYVIRAQHGTRLLDFHEVRGAYGGTTVDLGEDRWVFLNTLFSLSESTLFMQLVDLADQGEIPAVVGYADLYQAVRASIDAVHMEGRLKAEILADPERFIESDPEVVETLRDQREAGKRLLLITNSEWEYVSQIMELVFGPHLDTGGWRELFDIVIVSASKPGFFADNNRLYRVVDEDRALLRPHTGPIEPGGAYFGGSARQVEESLGLSGDEILYVGDHLFGDVHVSKATLRWRTALVIRELEAELEAMAEFADREAELTDLMTRKGSLEGELAGLRLARQRAAGSDRAFAGEPDLDRVRADLADLDNTIAPLAIASGVLANPHWGLLMRAGADKSLFARQVERYADIYTSRVSNFLAATPYAYHRAFRSALPHDLV